MITTPKLKLISRSTQRISLPLKGVTLLLVGFSFLAALVVFLYPLEIETRESASWLHVLALKQGISLVDHSRVAFVEMQKGPMDPLLKVLIGSLFPFLESWHVIRFVAVLLPCAFILVSEKILSLNRVASPWRMFYLGSIGYLLLLLNAKEFLFVGRPDATAALLFLGFVYLSVAHTPSQNRNSLLHGALCGTTGMVVMLTNWRIAPCVVAVLGFTLWHYWQVYRNSFQTLLTYLMGWAIAAVTLWGLIFFTMFEGSWFLYYAHTFGFHSAASGWGITASGRGSALWFLLSLFNPYADPSALKGGPLLVAIAVYSLTPTPRPAQRNAWLILGGVVLMTNAVPYYMNYNGGGAWYFIPFVIVVWVYSVLHGAQMSNRQLIQLGGLVILLMFLNYRAVLLPTVHRIATMGQASQFMEQVRSLLPRYTLLSEDTFLFRTRFQGDVIDSGDEVEAVYETGYYGATFQQTVERYQKQIRQNSPNYIVTGFTQSTELDDLIEKQYVLAATAPQNFTANAKESLQLFRHKDLGKP
jgi:hypothetical protein